MKLITELKELKNRVSEIEIELRKDKLKIGDIVLYVNFNGDCYEMIKATIIDVDVRVYDEYYDYKLGLLKSGATKLADKREVELIK